MILIDLVYINSPGGIILSKEIIKYLLKNKFENNYEILLDNRNKNLFELNGLTKSVIKKGEVSRYFFYKKNNKRFKSYLCFGNVPPPFNCKKKVLIYFHNELLLNHSNVGFSLFKRFIFSLKKHYVKKINQDYNWVVQTNHIKELLFNEIKIESHKIYKHPIYSKDRMLNLKTKTNNFIYPSSNNPHKNNDLLLNAFILAANKTDQDLTLKITIKKSDIKININRIPSNLKVDYLGIIDHNRLIQIYRTSKFLIFPSIRESFGLPLIEGIQEGCVVLAPKLNYVEELISPSYTFDAYDVNSISETILIAIKNKTHKLQFIKVNSEIDEIFKKLLNV